jgi:GntR family transcriptional regulator/MocR family aminotransferase
LADNLGVSRWVVTEAYGALVAEGVLDARTGSGTRVASHALRRPAQDCRQRPLDPSTAETMRFDLRPGIPDARHVPRSRWAAAVRSALSTLPHRELTSAPKAGLPAARVAVAEHLARSRHALVHPNRVLITHGATDGMRSVADELYRRGHRTIIVEDPSWPRLREVAEQAGLRTVPVAADTDGIDVVQLERAAARTAARAALVTPAHQFPLGAALSPSRRDQIVRWARERDALLIEDDYDAEFRYDRRPIAALQRNAPERVVLLGSLSKSVSPALGLGWAVLPEVLGDLDRASQPSIVDQAALAHFIDAGDLDRHLRASRGRLRRRRERLLEALDRHLPGITVSGIAAGMHFVVTLPAGCSAGAIVSAAASSDIALTDLARYVHSAAVPEALVLGYGNLDDALVDEGVSRLAAIIVGAPGARS